MARNDEARRDRNDAADTEQRYGEIRRPYDSRLLDRVPRPPDLNTPYGAWWVIEQLPPAEPPQSGWPKHVRAPGQPLAVMFADDGVIPNNAKLPFVLYQEAIDVADSRDPAAVIERVFTHNGWGDMWRNGVYGFVHYHSSIHEVLGVARGRARVQFGGEQGEALDLTAGDVAILPAGTGHCRLLASEDFLLVGAYPPTGEYDLCRSSPIDRSRALISIPKVPLPENDPVYGPDGPLLRLWQR